MLSSLGQLYVRGISPDWGGYEKPYSRRKVPLPTYAFQRKEYIIEGEKNSVDTSEKIPVLEDNEQKNTSKYQYDIRSDELESFFINEIKELISPERNMGINVETKLQGYGINSILLLDLLNQ